MKRAKFIPLITVSLVMSSVLAACGGRAPGLGAEVPQTQTPVASPDPNAVAPAPEVPYTPPVDYPTNTNPVAVNPGVPTGPVLIPAGSFKVDQGNIMYDWRARGIAVSGGSIYVAAVDNEGMAKNGTVLKIDAISGKNWKDLGTSFLGLSSPLSATLQSVTIAGGNLFALDSTEGLFSISTSGGNIKALKGAGGTDIAGSNVGLIIAANGMLERGDMSGGARSPLMPQIMTSAGVGSDSRGNIFFINGPRVGVLPMQGMPQDVVQQGLMNAVDVTADGRTGEVYVLDGMEVKRFANGQLVSSSPHGAAQAISIALDEMGNVYVSDYGASSGDSKIIKLSQPNGAMNGMPTNGMNAGYPQTGYANAGYAQQTAGQGYSNSGAYAGYGQQTAYGQVGAYPQQTGMYPQTGAYPQTGYTGYSQQSTGAYPQQATGAYPQATGAYPQQTGAYGAYNTAQNTGRRY